MKTVRELHDKAMGLAQLALVARGTGDVEKSERLAHQAYGYEAQAAQLVSKEKSSEPTRSILFRGAASLAYQCREFDTALRLIAEGLSGYPPFRVKEELKELYQQVTFEDHLLVRGVTLAEDDLQLSIHGKQVGTGMILYSDFVRRIEAVYSIFGRTIQRMSQKAYQRVGRLAEMQKYFVPALSVPREGSFAITFKLGSPVESHQIPMLLKAPQIIDEVMNGMEYINSGKEEDLEKHIGDKHYYLNFVTLTRNIAPDGEKVSLVGFTTAKRTLPLTRASSAIGLPSNTNIDKEGAGLEPIKVTGVLDHATKRRGVFLGITTEDGKQYDVRVREGMDDFVRAYFDQIVTVTGLYDGKYIHLTDLQPADK